MAFDLTEDQRLIAETARAFASEKLRPNASLWESEKRLDRDTLAPSNAALVGRVVQLCEKHGRPVATPAQARDILGLPQVVSA